MTTPRRTPNQQAVSSGLVDWNDPTRNLYGCAPCPQCGENYRAAYNRPGGYLVECGDCGFKEPATFAEDSPRVAG